jgi:hypothetical protein
MVEMYFPPIIAGATSMLPPVTNLSTSYVLENNTVLVTWGYDDNMDTVNGNLTDTTDGDITFELFYNITIAGTVLHSGSDMDTSADEMVIIFTYTISADVFLQAGVSVRVMIRATDTMRMSTFVNSAINVPGGEN